MKWIVGLGNPGPDYDNHRHNLGFWVVDQLAKKNHFEWEKSSNKALEAWGSLEGEDCWLIKPLTWMNKSGESVKRVLNERKGVPDDLLVVHDDIDIKLGKMRWTFDSGHGGNNGIRSVIEAVGTQKFFRLRLGVGRPPAHEDPADYVLKPFVGEDLEVAETLTTEAVQSVHDFLKHGLDWVKNKYH